MTELISVKIIILTHSDTKADLQEKKMREIPPNIDSKKS